MPYGRKFDKNFVAVKIGKVVVVRAAVDFDVFAAVDVIGAAVRIKFGAAVLDGVIAFAEADINVVAPIKNAVVAVGACEGCAAYAVVHENPSSAFIA